MLTIPHPRCSLVATVMLLLCLLVCASCTAPAITLRHVVLIKLNDSSELSALEGDCDAKLAAIPSVVEYSRGRAVDTGRAAVDCDYDLAIEVAFSSLADYHAYLAHPEHLALVTIWRPKSKQIRIFDFEASR
ncbi:MAG: Dabb family protein [Phycisphaerales bacterium]|nr:Dabb family protein [Phycisphaerales bacterium]